MEVNKVIQEWTKRVRVGEDYFDSVQSELKKTYPTQMDFEKARQEIYQQILFRFSEEDQQNYFISSQYLNQRNKKPEVLKYARIRIAIQKKLYRFYEKLFKSLYTSDPKPDTNISMRCIFRSVDEELSLSTISVEPKQFNPKVMDQLVSELNAKLQVTPSTPETSSLTNSSCSTRSETDTTDTTTKEDDSHISQ